MRRSALVLLLAIASTPAFAAHTVSIAQLEQQLPTLRGKSDADAAWQIAGMQLTERLSAARLAQLQNQASGEKTRRALQLLAADSAFLPPPPAEIPSTPSPDVAEQKRIMSLVVAYVAKTLPQLPNFVATRTTSRYEDTPQLQQEGVSFIPYQPMHSVSTDTVQVVYEDGREQQQVRAKNQPASELSTWGVFGPILATVLLDAAQSKLAFARWEQEPDGPRAVFAYAVPREKSHYEVDYCCVAAQAAAAAAIVRPCRKATGYRGEISVDPAAGTIRRLVLQAELKSDDPINKADILVDYGPVEIAGRIYTCPLRSISRSQAQGVQVNQRYHYALANQIQPLKNSLNDVRFTNYHVFRGDTRLLAEGSNPPPATPADSMSSEASAVPPAPSPAAPAPPAPSDSSPTTPIAAENPPAPPEPPATPEITETTLAPISDTPAAGPSAATSGFTLRTTTRLVDVAVVAFDKKGRPVTDLKPGDLEIYDNGRKQQVSFFTQAGAGTETASLAAPVPSAPADQPQVQNSAAAATPTHIEAPANTNTTILLIDAGNVVFADLTYARSEMQRFLKTVAVGERVGLYIFRSHGFEVLEEPSADHARIASALAKWTPSAQDLQRAQESEERNRQHFDTVRFSTDLAYVNGNGEGGSDPSMFTVGNGQERLNALSHPPDAKLRTMGSNPERDALYLLQGVGRHLAGLPGHKTLVWVASDNVLADWSSSVASHEEKGSKYIDTLAIHTREILNEAHVSIYPLDVSQLETSGVAADLGRRNINSVGQSDRDPSYGHPANAASQPGDIAPLNKPGRESAQMKADTHPIHPTFRELAEATGGRAFRRSGEIAAELNQIVADGRAAYLLAFHPDTQPDDQYHVITVKSTQPGLTLRYRTGYLYAKEAATMRDRIRQAIWDARDATDIGVQAQIASPGSNQSAKLTVSAADLALAQRAGLWTDKLHVLVVVRNDSDLRAKVTGRTLNLQLKPATYQRILKEGINIDQPFAYPQQSESVRILVIDENSGRIGAITLRQ